MSRGVIILNTPEARKTARRWVDLAPDGTSVTFKRNKRSLPQNDRFWAMLSDIASQKDHHGRRYNTEQWKAIFMAAIGHEISFIPSLDGKTFIPWGNRSSELTIKEMTDLMEFMAAWGAENGVEFHEPRARAA